MTRGNGFNDALVALLISKLLTGGVAYAADKPIEPEKKEILLPTRAPEVPEEIVVPEGLGPDPNWKVKLGFGYRWFQPSPKLENYIDQTRDSFEGSMNGFSKFLKVGDQIPFFTASVGYLPGWHIFPNDSLEFLLSADVSSSAIFGDAVAKKTFDAFIEEYKLDLGKVPTTWTQNLDIYASIGVGFAYSPVKFGKGVAVRPVIAFMGGPSYMKNSSNLHIHMNGNDLTDQFGQEVLNAFNIYLDINTDAEIGGWGWFVQPSAGVSLEIPTKVGPFSIETLVSYRHEEIPEFKIKEHTVQDGQSSRKTTTVGHEMSGLYLQVLTGLSF
jgi:hypothetical protein